MYEVDDVVKAKQFLNMYGLPFEENSYKIIVKGELADYISCFQKHFIAIHKCYVLHQSLEAEFEKLYMT
ncbi:hypothetical protein H1220_05555 [Carnobacteriaceae bacterium zg-84]|uniref:hypothetical protein n=1 Tax=Granulicatella sp. zg-84 TaxID=2678503 RepID=UPI0013D8D201|nr:hypothetical protein [Granulicatella sp. zg-84]QMI85195.1 hypothetical protein H1220_05555 [Carnobacteriaceae bacterium zg-84]